MLEAFENQIIRRKEFDDNAFIQSFDDLSGAILGKTHLSDLADDSKVSEPALRDIFSHMHIKPAESPVTIKSFDTRLSYMLQPTGVMHRSVILNGKWWQNAVGDMMGYTKDDQIIALLPGKLGGYSYFDYKAGKKIRINSKTAQNLKEEAICFYDALPNKSLKLTNLLFFMARQISLRDIVFYLVMAEIITLVGMLSPKITQLLYGTVIPLGDIGNVFPVAVFLIGVLIAQQLFSAVNTLITNRISMKMNSAVSAAAMARLLNMPAAFFKGYSSGELSSRMQSISSLATMLESAILTSGINVVFSLQYLFQINSFAPSLAGVALLVMLVQIAVVVAIGYLQVQYTRKNLNIDAKLSGMVFTLFSGVQKIKLAGAEKRAFSKWSSAYSKSVNVTYDPPLILKLQSVLPTSISLAAAILFYYLYAITKGSVANYMAFIASYAMASGAILSFASVASTLYSIRPVFEMAEPLLKTVPEVSASKTELENISGHIALNNVSFKYEEDGPLILNKLNLKVEPGEYLAIVGRTGCGKSTLMRLLLGFETPSMGAVYYDNHDVKDLDMHSIRRNIGVVLQNGNLFAGDIYSNIVISAPWLTLDDAWEAAEKAGIADDIRLMPMGMNTIISEGEGGISGGQKQRIMIARAIAPKPKVLFLDEATSALDNISQKAVSDSLAQLKCTRIVIAHRLSTIKQCDRIVVLDGGHVIEDGKYDELVARNGVFAELVARQRVET